MEERTALADLIRRARRRLYLQLAAHALGDACAIFLGGATLALLAGTAILGLPFFVLLIVASSCFAGWRARAGIGSPYQTAQKLDRRLSLPDPLSTALYFSDHPARPEQAGIVSRQRKEAEQAALSADVAYAFPFAASRGLYASGALLFAATGLFFLRFGINHRLELNTPLVHLAFGSGATPAADPPAARKRLADRRALNIPGLPPAPWDTAALDNHKAGENMLQASGTQESPGQGEAKQSSLSSEAGNVKNEKSGTKSGDGSSPGESGSPQDPANAAPSDNQDAQQSSSNPAGSQSLGNSRGLMDRMKDAMSDLLSTLKPNSNKQESSQAKGGGASQAGAQRQASSNSGQTPSNAERSAQDANAQGEAGAQSGQKTEAASKGRAGDSASAHNNSPDAKSGVGSQDGNKDSKYAEQLAAMGKISELIGKRSANITGEVMVEVASGNQQLKTQYSSRSAAHSDGGGEIGRDEVPLAYQQYVQQYFEEIRKSPPPRSPHSGAPGAAQ